MSFQSSIISNSLSGPYYPTIEDSDVPLLGHLIPRDVANIILEYAPSIFLVQAAATSDFKKQTYIKFFEKYQIDLISATLNVPQLASPETQNGQTIEDFFINFIFKVKQFAVRTCLVQYVEDKKWHKKANSYYDNRNQSDRYINSSHFRDGLPSSQVDPSNLDVSLLLDAVQEQINKDFYVFFFRPPIIPYKIMRIIDEEFKTPIIDARGKDPEYHEGRVSKKANRLRQIVKELNAKNYFDELNYINLHVSSEFCSIPIEIGFFKNLTTLSITQSQFTVFPETFYKLSNLRSLVFRDGNIHNLSEEIGKLTLLEELLLQNQPLDSLPTTLKKLTHLTSLNIMNTPLCEMLYRIPQELIENKKLRIQPHDLKNKVNMLRKPKRTRAKKIAKGVAIAVGGLVLSPVIIPTAIIGGVGVATGLISVPRLFPGAG